MDMRHARRECLAAVFVAALAAADARAQNVLIGANAVFKENVNPHRTQTFLSLFGAPSAARIRNVTFGWSATGCAAAVKVKFFRYDQTAAVWNFVTERGPFDVTNSLTSAGNVLQTVTLDPPVPVLRLDAVALTNVTGCGGPTWGELPGLPLPTLPPPPATLVADGDRTGVLGIGDSFSTRPVQVYGTGTVEWVTLLYGRFTVRLTATDPRTGRTTVGAGHPLGSSSASGYFSLPDFTGDDDVPEVTVKMSDATLPSGGAVWFFYSSLTDVVFTLTVTDNQTNRVRTYGSAGSPVFCGEGDTDAFPP